MNMSQAQFKQLLGFLKSNNSTNQYKHFQKEYKEYLYENVTVQNYKNTETRIFRQSPVIMLSNLDAVLIGYNRNKLTFLSVPSTTNIYDMIYVKRLIFRVNNRIFINFEIGIHKDGSKTYQVFVNYNHESNIDTEGVLEMLKKILGIFGVTKSFEVV